MCPFCYHSQDGIFPVFLQGFLQPNIERGFDDNDNFQHIPDHLCGDWALPGRLPTSSLSGDSDRQQQVLMMISTHEVFLLDIFFKIRHKVGAIDIVDQCWRATKNDNTEQYDWMLACCFFVYFHWEEFVGNRPINFVISFHFSRCLRYILPCLVAAFVVNMSR